MSRFLTKQPSAPHDSSRRISFLDELRGLDVLLMIGHHFLYTLGFSFGVWAAGDWFLLLGKISPLFSGQFVFISGICCCLTHSNAKRGARLAVIALGMTVFLYIVMPEQVIWYGVLHMLATGMLLFALLRRWLRRIPPVAGLAVCLLLFVLTAHVPIPHGGFFGIPSVWEIPVPEVLQQAEWLYPTGLSGYVGADYFPMIPWLFLFFAGSFVGRWAEQGRFPRWTYPRRSALLSFIGRHSLLIYLAHQPIIYVVLWLVWR